LSETALKTRKPPIHLGEDNEYVYKQVSGVSDEEYSELEKESHIGVDIAPVKSFDGAMVINLL